MKVFFDTNVFAMPRGPHMPDPLFPTKPVVSGITCGILTLEPYPALFFYFASVPPKIFVRAEAKG